MIPRTKSGLTPKQERFALEWLIDFNATQAAVRAGYSPRTANEQGARLLAKASVQALVAKQRDKFMRKADVSKERVIEEYRRIAFAEPRAVMTWGPSGVILKESSELTEDEAAAVAEVAEVPTREGVAVRIKMHSKTEALKALAQHLGLFDGHTGEGAAPAEVKVLVVNGEARVLTERILSGERTESPSPKGDSE